MMDAKTFVNKAIDIARNYKTLYVMGCFGSPLTGSNVNRFCNNHSYNRAADRTAMIKRAGASGSTVFGFDCVCLIKGILWGWFGDANKTHGGATYCSNGVPDYNADKMFSTCSNVSTDFKKIAIGEALWCKGHIGIYIGDGKAVECTPSWDNKVQITCVANIGYIKGYNARKWTKHGKLPYVKYGAPQSTGAGSVQKAPATTPTTAKLVGAASLDKTACNGVTLTTTGSVNLRYGPDSKKYASMKVLSKGTKVKWYGYYTGQWYLIKAGNLTGYCHSKYLKR